jgi:hypothetical protein
MSDPIKPMDVYSTGVIPFSVAAWARGHKFSPRAVELARRLKVYSELQTQIDKLEHAHKMAYADIKSSVRAIEEEDAREVNAKVAPELVHKYIRVQKAA